MVGLTWDLQPYDLTGLDLGWKGEVRFASGLMRGAAPPRHPKAPREGSPQPDCGDLSLNSLE